MRKKRIQRIAIVLLFATVFAGWIAWGNKALMVSSFTISDSKIPASFSGFRIAQISDLHNTEFGEDNRKLIEMLADIHPDMIAITGDLIDYYDTDVDISLTFVEKAMDIAPCYYIPGNHEARVDGYRQFCEQLETLGVAVLENERVTLEREGESVVLMGVKDPAFLRKVLFPEADNKSERENDIILDYYLDNLCREDGEYTILLSHRPDQIGVYIEHGIDLVLSGHKHGAQFRLPYLGGLFTPSDGFFPDYDAGLYECDHTTMIVSRGLGNSSFPFRINNRPEIVVIELQSE